MFLEVGRVLVGGRFLPWWECRIMCCLWILCPSDIVHCWNHSLSFWATICPLGFLHAIPAFASHDLCSNPLTLAHSFIIYIFSALYLFVLSYFSISNSLFRLNVQYYILGYKSVSTLISDLAVDLILSWVHISPCSIEVEYLGVYFLLRLRLKEITPIF